MFLKFLNNRNCLIGGDFNSKDVSFGDSFGNASGKWLIDFCDANQFDIVNPDFPTCFHSINGSYIDKFLSRNILSQSTCVATPSFSDHSQICTHKVFSISDIGGNTNTIKMFSWTKVAKLNKFIFNEISKLNIPVNRNTSVSEIDFIAVRINEIFLQAIELFVPTAQVNYSRVRLSDNTLVIKRKYRSLLRHYNRNKFLNNSILSDLKFELKLVRNMMLMSINTDISNYFNNLLVNVNNVYAFHATVGAKKHGSKMIGINTIKDMQGNQVFGDQNICNLLAEQFANNHALSVNHHSIFENNVNNFIGQFKFEAHIIFNDQFTALPNMNDNNSSNQLLTTQDKVVEVISSRKNKSAVGPDEMPNKVLKLLDERIISLITIFFNHLIALGHFPQCWNRALVIPIPKIGKDKSCIANWRPISLLSCFSKIFERIIAEKMRMFIDEAGVIPFHQFGFQPGHSTCHPLALLQNKINNGLNNNEITTMVCLDIRAAFDTVWHHGLLYKMHQLNFPKYIISIIFGFLSDRSFKLKIVQCFSVSKLIVAGVPQGSVLGPILFNISNHDIPISRHFDLMQFADDTSIAITYRSAIGIERKINNYLAELKSWYNNWKFLLNEGKTDLVHFVGNIKQIKPHRRKAIKNLAIKLNNDIIRPSRVVKYLGVYFCSNNRFNYHIGRIISKFNKAKNVIGGLLYSQLVDIKFKRLLYSVYLRPILTYAAPVWFNPSNISSHQIECLRLVERKAIRQVYNIVHRARYSFKYTSNVQLYKVYDYKRLDLHMANLSINFHNKVLLKKNPLILKLTRLYDVNEIDINVCKRTDYLYNLMISKKLFNNNGAMTLFNRAAYKDNTSVYSEAQ